jgi:hypothetical protein
MSCQLLEHVLSEAQLDLDSQQVAHVQDLIDNSAHRHLRQALQPEQAWRLQVGDAVCVFFQPVCASVPNHGAHVIHKREPHQHLRLLSSGTHWLG